MKTLKIYSSMIKRMLLTIVTATVLIMLMRYGSAKPPALEVAVAAVPAGLLLWALLPWWRSLDEAAREASTSAHFWGGSFGLLLVLFVGIIEMMSVPHARPRMPEWLVGMFFAAAAQVAGYLMFHTVWWLRRGGWGSGE